MIRDSRSLGIKLFFKEGTTDWQVNRTYYTIIINVYEHFKAYYYIYINDKVYRCSIFSCSMTVSIFTCPMLPQSSGYSEADVTVT